MTSQASNSVFDGSIEQVWISFPEPPNHVSTLQRSRNATSMPMLANRAAIFAYTRYDWNFLSTLSPTVLSWFSLIDRLKTPLKDCFEQRERYVDGVLAYFLIDTKPKATLPQSCFNDVFTLKTKYLLANPVCRLVNEIRKKFNQNTRIPIDLQANLLPEVNLLKQGIREVCQDWTSLFQQESRTRINGINRDVRVQTTKKANRIQSLTSTLKKTPVESDSTDKSGYRRASMSIKDSHDLSNVLHTPVRRRMTTQNAWAISQNHDTRIDMDDERTIQGECRRSSSFLGNKMIRMLFLYIARCCSMICFCIRTLTTSIIIVHTVDMSRPIDTFSFHQCL
jgi:hypothetical protein